MQNARTRPRGSMRIVCAPGGRALAGSALRLIGAPIAGRVLGANLDRKPAASLVGGTVRRGSVSGRAIGWRSPGPTARRRPLEAGGTQCGTALPRRWLLRAFPLLRQV